LPQFDGERNLPSLGFRIERKEVFAERRAFRKHVLALSISNRKEVLALAEF